ncbi:unnamed protein product [Thelazia callipaeda]|uniref:Secreted protein n=1 Tax=Thelazia callipaeda TaxID=103827 RepID=A0A0N5D5I1_THECL|nr:unnamed protein product [Thelazia callipaeda]
MQKIAMLFVLIAMTLVQQATACGNSRCCNAQPCGPQVQCCCVQPQPACVPLLRQGQCCGDCCCPQGFGDSGGQPPLSGGYAFPSPIGGSYQVPAGGGYATG